MFERALNVGATVVFEVALNENAAAALGRRTEAVAARPANEAKEGMIW